jgi:hypothetical protein
MIQILRPYLGLLKEERKALLGNMVPEKLKHYFDEKILTIMKEFAKIKYAALGIENPLESIDALISIVSNILDRFEHPGRGRKRQEHPLT